MFKSRLTRRFMKQRGAYVDEFIPLKLEKFENEESQIGEVIIVVKNQITINWWCGSYCGNGCPGSAEE